MDIKRDSLGRRIPDFDRSAAGKKSAATQKEKYGDDYHKRTGASGGRSRTRGYFGYLKDEGRTDELKKVSSKGGEKSKIVRLDKWDKESKGKSIESKGSGDISVLGGKK